MRRLKGKFQTVSTTLAKGSPSRREGEENVVKTKLLPFDK
jgi:hypothetical protein